MLDGEAYDVAGPTDGTTNPVPPTDRVWLAQGRQRIALQATTRARMETRNFSDFDGVHQERPLAVEFGNAYRRLYTLTEDKVLESSQPVRWALYVESTTLGATPAAPVQKAVHKFVDECWFEPVADCNHPGELHWPGWDPLEDIKLWELSATQDLIVARSQKRIITLRLNAPATGAWSFEIRGWARELFKEGRGPDATWGIGQPWFHDSSGTIDPYKVALLSDVTLGLDQQGRLMAYTLAQMGGYGPKRPLPEVMVVCDLDSANGFASPTFDFDLTSNVHYRVFDPMQGIVPPSGGTVASEQEKADNKAYGLDAYTVPNVPPFTAAYVYVSCGRQKQVQRVEVSNLPYGGPNDVTVFLAGTRIDVEPVIPPNQPGDDLFNVIADPLTPATRMYVVGNQDFYVWDKPSSTATVYKTDHLGSLGYPEKEANGQGLARDGFLMKGLGSGGAQTGLWVALTDQTDFIGKIFDLTAIPPPSGYLTLIAEFFGIFASDGGVAVGNDLYFPTFGGVVHYQRINGKYQYPGNADSYQPAEDPPKSSLVNVTEHITSGQFDLAVGGNQKQLLIAAAQACAFTRFIVDGTTKDPGPVLRINPNNNVFNNALKAVSGCTVCPGSGTPDCKWCLDCQVTAFNPACLGTSNSYGNDAAAVDMQELFGGTANNKFLITDLTKHVVPDYPGNVQVVLSIFRWQSDSATWFHLASVASTLIPVTTGAAGTFAIAVAKHPSSGKLFAFVGHRHGVAVFDIDGLPRVGQSLGTIQYAGQFVPTDSWVSALVVVEDRLFFVENGSFPTPPFSIPGHPDVFGGNTPPPTALLQLKCYQWTTSGTNPLQYRSSLILDHTLPPWTAPDNPGPCIRGRVRVLPGGSGSYTHNVYFAGQPYLTKWGWPGANGPDYLDLTGYWNSDYDSYLQDCRIVTLDLGAGLLPYVLVVKDRESVSIVGPVQ